MRLAGEVLILVAWLASSAMAADPKPRVTMEILSQPGLPVTAPQQWSKALSDLGVAGVQIRSGGTRDEARVTRQGNSYQVVGVLGADNRLQLPGGRFALSETAKLRTWLDNLADQGTAGVTEPRGAFGMTAQQLETITVDLRRPVGFSTLGMPSNKAISKITSQLKASVEIDSTLARELASLEVADELQDISAGTALAALLRPAGMSLVPERPTGGSLRYQLVKARAGKEAWPIGWPPQQRPNQIVPAMTEMINVEITQTPVKEAVEAIQGRLQIPLLFDRNAMTMHGIDYAAAMTEVPSKRMTYSQILNKILFDARLKFDVRLDDADRPFVWITTIKPAG